MAAQPMSETSEHPEKKADIALSCGILFSKLNKSAAPCHHLIT